MMIPKTFDGQLTEIELDCFRLLYFAKSESIWGVAIRNFWNDPTPEKFRELLEQLRSQTKDQPQIMEDILGIGLTQLLLTDKLWK